MNNEVSKRKPEVNSHCKKKTQRVNGRVTLKMDLIKTGCEDAG
jgi:hypothetical protein